MDDNLLAAFAFGAGTGLLLTFYAWWRGFTERQQLKAEIRRLREHLQSHVELSHEGTVQRKEEIERLRRENENLRVSLQAWQHKPDRRQLRTLHLYDHAARQLMKSTPGFASHWESALEQAEQVIAREERGILAFARRLVLPRSGGPPPTSPNDAED